MPSTTGKVTIRDVAAAAGVSPATVSLVYNDKGEVAAATRERVLEAGRRLGYQPGWISKVFRSGRTNVLGIAVQHGTTSAWERTYLPYYRGIIAGAALEALDHGYTVTAVRVAADGSFDDRFSLDGMVIVDPRRDDPAVRLALSQGIAVIAEGGCLGDRPEGRIRSVRADVETGVPLVLDELRKKGARRPAFFRGPSDDLYTELSLDAYRTWCAAHAVEALEYTLPQDHRPIDGARELLSGDLGRLDAVYCLNNTYGGATVAAAAELGLGIPDRLHVAAAAEAHEAAVDPRLVYLELDPVESGATCVRMLIDLIEGRSPEDRLLPARVLNARTAP